MTIIYALILFGVLIFVHEFGHFIVAKLMGVKVQKFSLGFGPKIVGFTRGDTEYVIAAFPLGGFVKMLGQSDMPEEDGEETISEEDKPRAFLFQPVWKRFLIVLAGPVFNLLFASLTFMTILMIGIPAMHPDVGATIANSPAQLAGVQKGDRILEIEGEKIAQWEEMTAIIYKNPGKPLDFKIMREGKTVSLKISPEKKKEKNIFGEEIEIGLIGIRPLGTEFTKRFSPLEAIPLGFRRTYDYAALNMKGIAKLIQRTIPSDSIGGPILIFQMAGKQASHGALTFFTFMGGMNVMLGIMNLLPIPVLDGGHLFFFVIEWIRKKPLSDKIMLNAQKVGLALLALLMAFAFYNDILRIIIGKPLP